MRVRDILKLKPNQVFTVEPTRPLSECVILMSEEDLGSLLVLENGLLVGLLTFREVINVLGQRQKERRCGPTPPFAEMTVQQVMNRNPMFTSPSMDVSELRSMMVNHRQRYLPVLECGELCGIVSFHDVAKAVHEEQGFENQMLKRYIQDWPIEERALL
jgi:CBS domain-containing protein